MTKDFSDENKIITMVMEMTIGFPKSDVVVYSIATGFEPVDLFIFVDVEFYGFVWMMVFVFTNI